MSLINWLYEHFFHRMKNTSFNYCMKDFQDIIIIINHFNIFNNIITIFIKINTINFNIKNHFIIKITINNHFNMILNIILFFIITINNVIIPINNINHCIIIINCMKKILHFIRLNQIL